MNYVGKHVAVKQGSTFYSDHPKFRGIKRQLKHRNVVTIEYEYTGKQPWVQWKSGRNWCWTDARNVVVVDEKGFPIEMPS